MDVVLPSVHLGTPTVVATVYPQLVTGRVPEKGERGGGGGVSPTNLLEVIFLCIQ